MAFSRITNYIHKAEEYILSLLLSVMILLTCAQIFLRQFFDSGLPWADPLLRHLVVWGGFLGAVLAVAYGKHISLDILSHFLSNTAKKIINTITLLFSTVVSGVLTYASYLFVISEMEFGSGLLLAIPSWGWNLIFPIAFAVMTIRYGTGTVMAVLDTLRLDRGTSK